MSWPSERWKPTEYDCTRGVRRFADMMSMRFAVVARMGYTGDSGNAGGPRRLVWLIRAGNPSPSFGHTRQYGLVVLFLVTEIEPPGLLPALKRSIRSTL